MAVLHQAVLDPAQLRIADRVIMGVEGHRVIAGLENTLADCKPLARPQMHAVLVALDDDILDDDILEGADVNAVLRPAQVQAAEALDGASYQLDSRLAEAVGAGAGARPKGFARPRPPVFQD